MQRYDAASFVHKVVLDVHSRADGHGTNDALLELPLASLGAKPLPAAKLFQLPAPNEAQVLDMPVGER